MFKIFLLLPALFLAGALHAQSWPTKPERVIVDVAPGGDGYMGFEAAVRAGPDGYTLLYAPGSTKG